MSNALSRSTLNGLGYTGKIYSNYDLSTSSILSKINSIKNLGVDSNDVTFFYYSGHGTQGAATEDETGIVGTDNYYIDVPTLKSALDLIPGTVIVVLDSCFSGMFIGKSASKGTSAAFDPKAYNTVIRDAFTAPAAKGLTTGKYQVITACRKGETSINVLAGTTTGGTKVYCGLATLFIAQGSGYDLYNASNTALQSDTNNNSIATIQEVFDFADAKVDDIVARWNEPNITQDMQYFTTNTSYPLFGRN